MNKLNTSPRNRILKGIYENISTYLTSSLLVTQVILLVILTQRVIGFEKAFKSLFNITPPEPVFIEKIPDDRGYSMGPKNASITVVEFADYECPACSEATPLIKDLVDTYSGEVRFVHRHYPLSSIHSNAFTAALAAECAGEQGKFWEMHAALFQSQNNLNPDTIRKISNEIGVNEKQFTQCLSSNKYEGAINQDIEEGQKYGVTGTPTFFVDKQMAISVDEVHRLVEEKLNDNSK